MANVVINLDGAACRSREGAWIEIFSELLHYVDL